MQKFDESHIYCFKCKYKGFVAEVRVKRSELKWEYDLYDNKGVKVVFNYSENYFSEDKIFDQIRCAVNDCIHNPEEYYN